MADEKKDLQDRTEEASPERREEFRERGQIAVSKDITSVFVLAAVTLFLALYLKTFTAYLMRYMTINFENLSRSGLSNEVFKLQIANFWTQCLKMILPFFVVSSIAACVATFFQTRLNWSWHRLKPDFNRLNPLAGLKRMVGKETLMELFKGIAKMFIVGTISYLILKSEWRVVPGILSYSLEKTWAYWGEITSLLFSTVACALLLIGGLDYIFNYVALERQMKMTKEEVKEEFKKREVDPQVKAKIKRMQRDVAMAKAVQAVPKATVVITNPEHFAVALLYELGMRAPIVLAKGQDFLAQRMKEVAKENEIPIVENKPLARTLYKMVESGQEIPEALYRAVSEVIRYVFLLKGKPLGRK